MKAVLLVAHGSRREASNDEVRRLAVRLQAASQYNGDQFRCAFLEIASPSIPDGIQQCIDAGASEVTVLPYFSPPVAMSPPIFPKKSKSSRPSTRT